MENTKNTLDPNFMYSVKELAFQWNLSAETIRRIFDELPGVIVFETKRGDKRRRRYRTLRIPGWLALHELNRLRVA